MDTAYALVVDSATGVDVELPVAGPGARSFAFLVDWLIRTILAAAWYVVAAMHHNHGWSIVAPLTPDSAWFIYVVAPPAALYFLYHPVWEVATRGRTPGKRMAGVRIVSRDGGAPGVGALLTRNVFRLIDSFPVAYALGLIATMVTRNNVRIGDLAAGTLLVHVHPLDTAAGGAANRLQRLSKGKTDDTADAAGLADDYRMLAHDVARARQRIPDSLEREALEATYAQAHSALYRTAWHPWYAGLHLFRDDIPAVVSWLRPHIIWATTLFILTVAAGYAMVRTYPDLIALFASPELIASVERGQLWTEGLLNVVPSSVLSLQILTNNIVVSLFAYCAGFLFGLGTCYILGLNGLMLGAVFAFTGLHALDDDLFRFVVAHGCVEISVMCLSGAAGAAVGEALIRPGAATRAESFQQAALRSGKLILACVLLLVGSGLIEGYISPSPKFSLTTRVSIGVAYWLFMIALLNGWLFGRRKTVPTTQAAANSQASAG
jgi:uncharacterized membrane protein SpoIIM required for sporulation/uncharacterized RDD family membrane protein YckC